MAGATAATGSQPGAVREWMPLRHPLAHPSPGEVEDLVGAGRQGQKDTECGDLELGVLRRGVREHGVDDEHSVLVQVVVEGHLEPDVGNRPHGRSPAVGLEGRGPPRGRLTTAAVPGIPGCPEPALAGDSGAR